ncbi:MAG: hypothetical protein CM15mP49_16790 [Actinomycetota bacterium]|nr:MAG: hypothetical protein CM15mP49_16790 [Actinomycetota bacterium]
MVGPEAEKSGLVRHVSRMFVNARSVTVPTGTIVLRKAYGLGRKLWPLEDLSSLCLLFHGLRESSAEWV